MYMRRRFILSIISFYILAVYVYAAPAKISFSADKMHGSGSKGNSSTALTGNAQVSVDSVKTLKKALHFLLPPSCMTGKLR